METIKNTIKLLLEKAGINVNNVKNIKIDDFDVLVIYSDELKFKEDFVKSLQHIAKKISCTEEKIILDINEYYIKKIQKYKKVAPILAKRALSFESDVELKPMPASERFIIHSILQNFDEKIQTQSIGVGKNRRVVIKYIK